MRTKDIIQILFAVFIFSIGINLLLKLFKLRYYYGFIFVILFLIIYKFIDKKDFSYYGLRKFNLNDIKKAYYILTLLFPVSLIARLIDGSFDIWYASQIGINNLTSVIVISAFMPLFLIKEEIIERSLIQIKLNKYYGKLLTVIAIGINFGLLHFYFTNNGQNHVIASAIFVIFGGIILAVLFEITKNLFLSIGVHTIYNVLIIVQIYLHLYNGIYEMIFWVILMFLFLLSFKKSSLLIKDIFDKKNIKKFSFIEMIVLIIFILFPILFW